MQRCLQGESQTDSAHNLEILKLHHEEEIAVRHDLQIVSDLGTSFWIAATR